MRARTVIAGFVAAFGLGAGVAAAQIPIDTAPARAVLDAVVDADLTADEARAIARMPAYQQAIRKVRGNTENGTEDRFVAELVAVAHGQPLQDGSWFRFERTLRDREPTLRTLALVEADPTAFGRFVEDRITQLMPIDPALRLSGTMIASNGMTGFAYGPDFYLNITHFPDDLEAAKVTTAHEMFHAVHLETARARNGGVSRGFNADQFAALADRQARANYLTDRLFYTMMTEGVGMYVGDPELLRGQTGRMSRFELDRLGRSRNEMFALPVLVDMTLIAATSDDPLAYRDTYIFNFGTESQPLYFAGYEMARVIAEKRGGARLGEIALGDGCVFAREYLDAVRDVAQPRLTFRERTLRMIEDACPAATD